MSHAYIETLLRNEELMANIGKPQRRIIVVPVRKTEPVSPRPEPEREREPSPTILPAPEKEKEKVSA